LQSFGAQENFKEVLYHFLNLFDAQPQIIATDKHPNYFTTNLGAELKKKWQIPQLQIQHHEAHFWAVLAENDLLTQEDVLGVIWDGTGLGNDAQIWGGEFLKYQNGAIHRVEHFDYFPHFLADKMPKEPRISALAICRNLAPASEILALKFSKIEWKLYQKLLKQKATLFNSSVGRIFDALASLLNLGDKQSFEGENAIKLEALAQDFYEQNPHSHVHYPPTLNTEILFQNIIEDILAKKNKNEISFKFHLTLITVIQKIARKYNCKKIAFSGGVWQNTLLIDLIMSHCREDFELYFHQQLPPNDENVSFGQMIAISQRKWNR